VALVIGNGGYKSSSLRNPVNDAKDMATALKSLGFDVVLKQNATQRSMEDAIRDFGIRLRKGGVGLFYYAGHGIQVDRINYLVPLGAKVHEEIDVKYETVDSRRVLDAMYNAGNNLNIVVLDACRDNPFARSFRSSSSGLARMDAPKGTLIAYSTSPGKVAQDGKGRNSPYTAALLKHMRIPQLSVEQVFKRVRRDLDAKSGGKQIPWESTSMTGDFYFVSTAKAKPSNSAGLDEERARLEAERRQLAEEKKRLEEERKTATARERLAKEKAKLEAERKRIAEERRKLEEAKKQQVAGIPSKPSVSRPEVIGRDGNYGKYASGVVKDTRTGLEWVVGPARNMTWDEASAWVQGLNVAGGGWRMPTTEELKTLYDKSKRENPPYITQLLKTTGWWVWSGETKGSSSASGFLFFDGRRYWDDRGSDGNRAFAVRSR